MATYEESSGEEFAHSPLPQEDRLWRHPSEMGTASAIEPSVVINRRWIERETTRGSAWTAGIVGAVLATGLVALGTHLATAFTTPPIDANAVSAGSTNELAVSGHGSDPTISGLSATIADRLRVVGKSVAIIDAGHNGASVRCLGMLINSSGAIVVPASAIANAASLLVTLSNGVQYVGVPEGTDTTSGIAIVRIHGAPNLPSVTLSGTSVAKNEMMVAVTATSGSTFDLGTVTTANASSSLLVDTLSTDISPTTTPLGSPLLDPKGHVVGIVTGATPSGVVATPSWLAAPVANELLTSTRVEHGWLGMVTGSTQTTPGGTTQTGVVIGTVATNSAGAEAGLHTDDVITSLDGRPVHSLAVLRGRLYVLAPNTMVQLGILRGTKHMTVNVELDDRVPS